jgi:hypothetical protein
MEEIALRLAGLDETILQLIGIYFTMVGVVIALFVFREEYFVRRATFYMLSAIGFFVSAIATWVLIDIEMLFGSQSLAVTFMITFGSAIALGFWVGWLGIGRSYDASGHRWSVLLAPIPFLNLILVFTPSKGGSARTYLFDRKWTNGYRAIAIGVLFMATGVAIDRFAASNFLAVSQGSFTQFTDQQLLEMRVQQAGLEQTLREMASGLGEPRRVDEVTMLVDLEATGSVLRRTYEVDLPVFAIDGDFRALIEAGVCAYAPFEPVLRAGATIREVYVSPNGSVFGEVSVSRAECRN